MNTPPQTCLGLGSVCDRNQINTSQLLIRKCELNMSLTGGAENLLAPSFGD